MASNLLVKTLITFAVLHIAMLIVESVATFVVTGTGDWNENFLQLTPLGIIQPLAVPDINDPDANIFTIMISLWDTFWSICLGWFGIFSFNYPLFQGHDGAAGAIIAMMRLIFTGVAVTFLIGLIQIMASIPFWYSRVGAGILGITAAGSIVQNVYSFLTNGV